MSQIHEQCPRLLSVVREFGNCESDYAQDCILTRVGTCSPYFQWRKFSAGNAYKRYNDLSGCYGNVHEIRLSGSDLISERTKTYALEMPICQDEFDAQRCIENPSNALDLEAQAVREIMNSLRLGKEFRIWSEVLEPANYTAGNLTDLTGNEIDNADPALAANPLTLIRNTIADTCSAARPNWAVMSRKTSEKLIQNKAFLGDGCCNVLNPIETVAALLGLTGICIADAKIDLAGLGLPEEVVDIFGDSILLYRRNDDTTRTDCPRGTFAMEATYTPSGAVSDFEVFRNDANWDMGLRGGVRVKVGYSSKIVYQYDLAHLITNVCV